MHRGQHMERPCGRRTGNSKNKDMKACVAEGVSEKDRVK